MWPNLQETVDLVKFTERILNEKLHFLYRVTYKNYLNSENTIDDVVLVSLLLIGIFIYC